MSAPTSRRSRPFPPLPSWGVERFPSPPSCYGCYRYRILPPPSVLFMMLPPILLMGVYWPRLRPSSLTKAIGYLTTRAPTSSRIAAPRAFRWTRWSRSTASPTTFYPPVLISSRVYVPRRRPTTPLGARLSWPRTSLLRPRVAPSVGVSRGPSAGVSLGPSPGGGLPVVGPPVSSPSRFLGGSSTASARVSAPPRLLPSPGGLRLSWGILLFLPRVVRWLRAARLRPVVLWGVRFPHPIRTCPLLFLLRGI